MEVNQAGHEPGQLAMSVTEASQVADARRRAAALAQRLGFTEVRAGALAIVVTEAASNLARHAQHGQLLLQTCARRDRVGVEVMALDRGPGMADASACFRDGFSTTGTSGGGLGAISRLSDELEIHTIPGVGTAMLARVWAVAVPKPSNGEPRVGVVCIPAPGETIAGDGYCTITSLARLRLVVVDGLGHGILAADASRAATELCTRERDLPLVELVHQLHRALAATRGAVAGIADVDLERNVVRFVGIGNIAATIWTPDRSHGMASMNGTIGQGELRVREFSYPLPADALLLLHSDGITSRADIGLYPGLAVKDPTLVAGVIYRDHCRGRDDATVMVAAVGKG